LSLLGGGNGGMWTKIAAQVTSATSSANG